VVTTKDTVTVDTDKLFYVRYQYLTTDKLKLLSDGRSFNLDVAHAQPAANYR